MSATGYELALPVRSLHAKAMDLRTDLALRCGLGLLPVGSGRSLMGWSQFESRNLPAQWQSINLPLERLTRPKQQKLSDYLYFEHLEYSGEPYDLWLVLSAEGQCKVAQLFHKGLELFPQQDFGEGLLQLANGAIDTALARRGLPTEGTRVWIGSDTDRLNAIGVMGDQARATNPVLQMTEHKAFTRTAKLLKGDAVDGGYVVVIVTEPLVRLELVCKQQSLHVAYLATG